MNHRLLLSTSHHGIRDETQLPKPNIAGARTRGHCRRPFHLPCHQPTIHATGDSGNAAAIAAAGASPAPCSGACAPPPIIHEGLVTSCSMYFRTSNHGNKEGVADGTAAIRHTRTSTNDSCATTKGLGPIKVRQLKPVLHGYELPNPLLRKC